MRRLKKLMLLSITAFLFSGLMGVEQVKQDAVNADFQENITAVAFDRYEGYFYVGTTAVAGDATRRLARAGRDTLGTAGFEALSTVAGAQGQIDHIALVNSVGAAATHLAFDRNGTNELRVLKLADNTVPAGMTKARTNAAGGGICDANGDAARNGELLMAGGYNATGNNGYIFLRVHANAGDNQQNSGILAFRIDGDTTVKVGVVATGNAARVDDRVGQGNFLRGGIAALGAVPVVNDIYWSEDLETLFVAGSVTNVQGQARTSAILKLKVTAVPNIEISAVLPDDVDAIDNNTTTIFATRNVFIARDPRILKIRTMLTSTGRDYLIVNGGIGDGDNEVGNQFYALQYNQLTGFVVQGLT